MLMRTGGVLGLSAACLLAAGCIGIRAEKVYSDSPTLGQELTDLKAAHDSGVVTDDEYSTLRARLIEERRRDD